MPCSPGPLRYGSCCSFSLLAMSIPASSWQRSPCVSAHTKHLSPGIPALISSSRHLHTPLQPSSSTLQLLLSDYPHLKGLLIDMESIFLCTPSSRAYHISQLNVPCLQGRTDGWMDRRLDRQMDVEGCGGQRRLMGDRDRTRSWKVSGMDTGRKEGGQEGVLPAEVQRQDRVRHWWSPHDLGGPQVSISDQQLLCLFEGVLSTYGNEYWFSICDNDSFPPK